MIPGAGFDLVRKELGSNGPHFSGLVKRMVHLALDGMGMGWDKMG